MSSDLVYAQREIDNLINLLADARTENMRLRAALREMAEHPTGGVGCNPEGFVKAARAALEEGRT